MRHGSRSQARRSPRPPRHPTGPVSKYERASVITGDLRALDKLGETVVHLRGVVRHPDDDRAGPATNAIEYAAQLTEVMLLGVVALRAGKKIEYDGKNMRVTNNAAANEFLQREPKAESSQA